MTKPTVKDLDLELTNLKKYCVDLNQKYELLSKKCVDLEKKYVECNSRKTKTFSCINCDETFRRKKDLQKHRETHSKVGVIQCKECDKTFDQEWKMKAINFKIYKRNSEKYKGEISKQDI